MVFTFEFHHQLYSRQNRVEPFCYHLHKCENPSYFRTFNVESLFFSLKKQVFGVVCLSVGLKKVCIYIYIWINIYYIEVHLIHVYIQSFEKRISLYVNRKKCRHTIHNSVDASVIIWHLFLISN